MHDNINTRDAKRILHGLHNILRCVRPRDLPTVAKNLAMHHHIHVFRKAELNRHGLVFTSQREYEMWKTQLGAQRELF